MRRGALSGFSVEFHSRAERRERGIRVIERADLSGLALVDRGAYPQSKAEVRARSGRTLRSKVPYNKRLACECIARGGPGSGAACVPLAKFAKVAGDGMAEAIEAAVAEARDILAVAKDYSKPLASASRGTLRAVSTDDGLDVEIDLPAGALGDDVIAANEAAGIIVRPLIDYDRSVYVDGPDDREVTKPYLRAFLVGATDAARGLARRENRLRRSETGRTGAGTEAVVALTPWPENVAGNVPALSVATKILGAALGLHSTGDAALIWRLGGTGSALVEAHAPDAPQPVKDEAVIRCAGWLLDAPASGVRSQSEGEIRTSYSPAMTSALRASRAMALLRPWAWRRAGAIG